MVRLYKIINSELHTFDISSSQFTSNYRLSSSTNNVHLNLNGSFVISFMYRRKSFRPCILPYGTPSFRGMDEDIILRILQVA